MRDSRCAWIHVCFIDFQLPVRERARLQGTRYLSSDVTRRRKAQRRDQSTSLGISHGAKEPAMISAYDSPATSRPSRRQTLLSVRYPSMSPPPPPQRHGWCAELIRRAELSLTASSAE